MNFTMPNQDFNADAAKRNKEIVQQVWDNEIQNINSINSQTDLHLAQRYVFIQMALQRFVTTFNTYRNPMTEPHLQSYGPNQNGYSTTPGMAPQQAPSYWGGYQQYQQYQPGFQPQTQWPMQQPHQQQMYANSVHHTVVDTRTVCIEKEVASGIVYGVEFYHTPGIPLEANITKVEPTKKSFKDKRLFTGAVIDELDNITHLFMQFEDFYDVDLITLADLLVKGINKVLPVIDDAATVKVIEAAVNDGDNKNTIVITLSKNQSSTITTVKRDMIKGIELVNLTSFGELLV